MADVMQRRDRGDYHSRREIEISERMEAARIKRMREIKDRIRSHGTDKMKAALRTAELGYGWQAVQLASWGDLSDDQAKDLTGFKR